MILRLLSWQGAAGLALSVAIGLLLISQTFQTRHWKAESARWEKLYTAEHSAFATTVASYRAAAAQVQAEDQANAARIAAETKAINERTQDAFEVRIAAARADAFRLRAPTAADPGARGNASVPRLSAPARGATEATGQGRLPPPDALIATEQAIQLDELVKWVRAQARVEVNAAPR